MVGYGSPKAAGKGWGFCLRVHFSWSAYAVKTAAKKLTNRAREKYVYVFSAILCAESVVVLDKIARSQRNAKCTHYTGPRKLSSLWHPQGLRSVKERTSHFPSKSLPAMQLLLSAGCYDSLAGSQLLLTAIRLLLVSGCCGAPRHHTISAGGWLPSQALSYSSLLGESGTRSTRNAMRGCLLLLPSSVSFTRKWVQPWSMTGVRKRPSPPSQWHFETKFYVYLKTSA